VPALSLHVQFDPSVVYVGKDGRTRLYRAVVVNDSTPDDAVFCTVFSRSLQGARDRADLIVRALHKHKE